jgi:hypothetical protein
MIGLILTGNRFWPAGRGPASEAESVRFHGRRVTKVGPEVNHGFFWVAGRATRKSCRQRAGGRADSRLSADAQTSAAGSERQRSGLSGRDDSVGVRFASRAASQHMEFAPGRHSGRVAKRRSAPLEHGPLEPNHFSLEEANERLATLSRRGRIRL